MFSTCKIHDPFSWVLGLNCGKPLYEAIMKEGVLVMFVGQVQGLDSYVCSHLFSCFPLG
jgi:hypothetical protein